MYTLYDNNLTELTEIQNSLSFSFSFIIFNSNTVTSLIKLPILKKKTN